MICQACGVEAPTKKVTFYQNIGALVMRFSKTADGRMCKRCIHSTFWKFTLTNLTLGWWGAISMIVTPVYTINNVVRYLMCLGMECVPAGAAEPQLTDDVVARLQPVTQQLFDRLNGGEDFERVADSVALNAGVTKGQVALYAHALLMASQDDAAST